MGSTRSDSMLGGDMLEKGIDYSVTFSATVGADTIRFFFSIGTALNLKFRGGDV